MPFAFRFQPLVLIALIASFLVSCSYVEIEGKDAPDFTVERFGSEKLSLSEFEGKPIILYWFASW
ncbi:MAG: redoxin domain-containing protein [Deltaproteobacteria bacterium]|nr:redoxin domain-containing protein [Deltaproteobacteria bacterium]